MVPWSAPYFWSWVCVVGGGVVARQWGMRAGGGGPGRGGGGASAGPVRARAPVRQRSRLRGERVGASAAAVAALPPSPLRRRQLGGAIPAKAPACRGGLPAPFTATAPGRREWHARHRPRRWHPPWPHLSRHLAAHVREQLLHARAARQALGASAPGGCGPRAPGRVPREGRGGGRASERRRAHGRVTPISTVHRDHPLPNPLDAAADGWRRRLRRIHVSTNEKRPCPRLTNRQEQPDRGNNMPGLHICEALPAVSVVARALYQQRATERHSRATGGGAKVVGVRAGAERRGALVWWCARTVIQVEQLIKT
jgi:hypothetical protein